MKYLFVAEKPSLMRDVEKCYNNHKKEIIQKVGIIDFIALTGHVCTNAEPKDYMKWNCAWSDIQYPMIPEKWLIKPIQEKYKLKILNELKKRIPLYDGIIVGTDSDTEGYGIYYLIEQFLKIEKKKTLRFMEHSLTDKEILHSLLTMTDFHTDPVHVRFTKAYLLRSQADWLFGMNCTRKISDLSGELMTIGRVKAPTIKLVYDNSMAIENFEPRKYFNLTADYGGFIGECVDIDGKTIEFSKENDIDIASIQKTGEIESVNSKKVSTHSPKLYDLASLQIEGGQTLGMTPDEILDTLQSLYEKHKVISYPRTQCRYVSIEKAKEFPAMLQKMKVFSDLWEVASKIKPESIQKVFTDAKVVNNKEVAKESHDALLPTSKTPILSEMNDKEIQICYLIYKRLLAQFLPELTEEKTRLFIRHGKYVFLVQGKIVTEQGWRSLYRGVKDKKIPELKKGNTIITEKMTMSEKITTPPKRLSQATLVSAMENIANQIDDKELKSSLNSSKGIGTAATRSTIIREIIARGYVEDKGKRGLYITENGKQYVENVSGISIISPVFAAKLDTEIKKIQRGEAEYDVVYNSMLNNLKAVCEQIDCSDIARASFKCPRCNDSMDKVNYNYICRKCGLEIPKQICGQKITSELISQLADKKVTKRMRFVKKDKTKFDARIRLTDEGLKFDTSLDIICPYCQQNILKGQYGYYCKCGLSVPNYIANCLSEKEIKQLIENQYLPTKSNFVSKKGNTFSAALKIENKKCEFVFN